MGSSLGSASTLTLAQPGGDIRSAVPTVHAIVEPGISGAQPLILQGRVLMVLSTKKGPPSLWKAGSFSEA